MSLSLSPLAKPLILITCVAETNAYWLAHSRMLSGKGMMNPKPNIA